jgi:hypothetical protein
VTKRNQQTHKWWRYVNIFNEQCSGGRLVGGAWAKRCRGHTSVVESVLEMAGVQPESVEHCMNVSGGLEADAGNSLLQEQVGWAPGARCLLAVRACAGGGREGDPGARGSARLPARPPARPPAHCRPLPPTAAAHATAPAHRLAPLARITLPSTPQPPTHPLAIHH